MIVGPLILRHTAVLGYSSHVAVFNVSTARHMLIGPKETSQQIYYHAVAAMCA